MTITMHHLKDGTFTAEVPTVEGTALIFSSRYASDSNRESQYDVLASLLEVVYHLVIPPLCETKLIEPGEAEVPVKIA